MSFKFLKPVENLLVSHLESLSEKHFGNAIQIHSEKNGFPDFEGVQVAILGVKEDRNSVKNKGCGEGIAAIRQKLYELFPGRWSTNVVDLGNIEKGNTISDTYFAVSDTISRLLKMDIIPVIIGGSQDITYANYRAYDSLDQTVNIAVIDSRFDLGREEDSLNSDSYLSKIIIDTPNNLFNFSNIGYQTYLNPQDEIQLIDQLNFDAYRLGEAKDLEIVEPILRDADIISLDMGAVRQVEAPANKNSTPNGFYGDEICAISRYAGISDKVTSFGIYEYNSVLDLQYQTAHLIAQIIWYFIEGLNFRAKDYPYCTKENYQKFTVMFVDDDPVNFYKSDKSGRWWMEINLISNTKHKRHALIPCTYRDYKETTNQIIPERWYKAMRKMS